VTTYNARCDHCGGAYTAQGIDRHEEYCKGDLDDDHDPDQLPDELLGPQFDSFGSGDNSGLPPRRDLPGPSTDSSADNSSQSTADSSGPTCVRCGSQDVVDASDARSKYQEVHDRPQDEVLTVFASAERYCNDCFAVWGGKFDGPFRLDELFQKA
jgi:hypothetical protein